MKLSLCYTFKCHFNLINLCGTYPSLKYVFNYDSKKAVHYKRLSETHIDEDEADSYDKKANLVYMQNSFIYYLELTISFIALFIIVLGNGNSSASSWALLPFMTTIISR